MRNLHDKSYSIKPIKPINQEVEENMYYEWRMFISSNLITNLVSYLTFISIYLAHCKIVNFCDRNSLETVDEKSMKTS